MNNITIPKLLPLVKHCIIYIFFDNEWQRAIVQDFDKLSEIMTLKFIEGKSKLRCIRVKQREYSYYSGFEKGFRVIASTRRVGRSNLEEGVVLDQKNVAGQYLVAVHFFHDDRILWIPFERLSLIRDHARNFEKVKYNNQNNQAERFRLKTLGYGIQLWNQNTGSLSSLNIDPLPHQINLVHHILQSGNLNWMIADDVGLGKTIETGMLITALKYRGEAKRILLVTPAGLTKQWKEELYYKFSFDDFRIYGDDFTINESREWRMYEHVIASIDRLKSDESRALLSGAGYWDLIIFDEAHRLTRSQYGNRYVSSGRFDVAALLRRHTDNLILLTATPHQGKSDQFQSLLNLLRPELKEEINRLNHNPEILSEMVYRNNKSKVTDLEGRKIFKGQKTYPIHLPVSQDAITFDRKLQEYLRKSAKRSEELGGNIGRAIGFVIAIYRKLAASSIAAILNALIKRQERLLYGSNEEVNDEDERFIGEFEERQVNIEKDVKEQFIEGEIEYLAQLIALGEKVRADDQKLQGFLTQVVDPILQENPTEKLVIFTEYLSTQKYLEAALKKRYGGERISLINGSMSLEERQGAIAQFNGDGQFILSTEAGGEGINLQHNCHILVNFDLPWNPMRLVQRIGRIYRYGQVKEVLIFNIFSQGTVDDDIVRLLYQKIDQVVNDLGAISDEFDEGLKHDIFGNIADLVEVDKILDHSIVESKEQTEEKLTMALEDAKAISQKQQELFNYVAQYDANALEREFVITLDHISAFIRGMCRYTGVKIIKEMYDGDIWVLKLPDVLMKKLAIRKQNIEVTINHRVKMQRPKTEVLDLNHPLMKYFIDIATSYEFGGANAFVCSDLIEGKAVITAIVKWQNLQGTSIHQDMITFALTDDGPRLNPPSFSNWLLTPAENYLSQEHINREKVLPYSLETTINEVLDDAINQKRRETLIPHDQYLLSAAWVKKS